MTMMSLLHVIISLRGKREGMPRDMGMGIDMFWSVPHRKEVNSGAEISDHDAEGDGAWTKFENLFLVGSKTWCWSSGRRSMNDIFNIGPYLPFWLIFREKSTCWTLSMDGISI
jgi:hypothetical protein